MTLKLDVTPQINLGTAVRLKLALKNDTLQNPQNPGLTPLINTSKITNTVIVKSDDVLVLGGLISHANNETVNKVPILGDMPVIGRLLFQQKISNQQKKNFEVIIVEDGSTVRCDDVVDAFRDQLTIEYVIKKKSQIGDGVNQAKV